jgi:hypothetical protein
MDQPRRQPEVPPVAEAIRRYLSEHPQAADTAEGIQRWWLLPSFGEVSLATVEAALALLEVEGTICRREQPWSPPAWMRAGATPPAGTRH